MKIGPYTLKNNVFLAPMAGVTDLPFRQLARQMEAGLVVSEMMTSNPHLWHTKKTMLRQILAHEPPPRTVQIVGSDPKMMAEAAQYNVQMGAQIIDINMGCPAKKVCNKAAGSALLKDERLVAQILHAVVNAVTVPVTLKTRTGWCTEQRNAVNIAKIAEASGIQALTLHGRTRACRFNGNAEYDTIAEVKQAVHIPVIANGDITSPEKARDVLNYTQADAIMIGRAAQGCPWLLREIVHYLNTKTKRAPPSPDEVQHILLQHLHALYRFYGPEKGVKIARKHICWYLKTNSDHKKFFLTFNKIEENTQQHQALKHYLTVIYRKSMTQ